ncbi:hypothetical protein V8F33_001460 [Rhypophila sp. PSN 637]
MNILVLAALSGIFLLQGAEAACCRTNKCLKAVGYDAGAVGLADCSANLAMTVTVHASTATETLTIFESAHDTVFVTETTTETASTETQLLTQVETITASTQTETVIAVAITEPFTVTNVETGTAITITSTQYSQAPTVLKARQTDTATEEVPEYASEDCANWAEYTRACKCAGLRVTTVTASIGPVETHTSTLTASGAVTTTVFTLTATDTNVVPVTATTWSTVTSQFSVVHTTTVEEVATVTVTTAVQSTTTPTTVVPLMCKPTGVSFQASMPFPDGSTRWINKLMSGNVVATQSFGTPAPALDDPIATWVLDSGGFLELALLQPGGTEKLAAYYDMPATKASVQIGVLPKSQVIAGVATGRLGRLKGCVSPNNQLFISAGSDRHNMLSCGNQFYMSSL